MHKHHTLASVVSIGLLSFSAFGCSAQETPAPAQPVAVAEKPNPSARWELNIAAFEAEDKKNPPPADAAVFVGSSSIRMWESLKKDFPEIPTIRRGFGGSMLSDSVYFADRIVIPYKPRVVVVYAGSNDVAAKRKPEEVLQDFQKFVEKVHAALPETRVAFISINPSVKRERQQKEVQATNALIENYVKGNRKLSFINSYSGLLGPDGLAQKEYLLNDGLHLNTAGYKRWVELVKPAILTLYQEAAPPAQ